MTNENIDPNDPPHVTPELATKMGVMVDCANARCAVEIMRDHKVCPICKTEQPER